MTQRERAPVAGRSAGREQAPSGSNASAVDDRSPRGAGLRRLAEMSRHGDAAVAQGAMLTGMFGPRAATIQRVKTDNKSGIRYAESEAEARRLMTDYARRNEIAVPANIMATAISVAQDKTLGIDQGERTILLIRQEQQQAEARQKRKDDYEPHYLNLLGRLDDDLAKSILSATFTRFVASPSDRFMTHGEDKTQDEVDEALTEWRQLRGKRANCDFWGFNRQDKAAAGKGNVGDTLDVREVQGNFLCKWGGHEINMHVNITD